MVVFTAPQKSGTFNGATRRYQVSADTGQRQGCVGEAAKTVGASRAGARVTTTLAPTGGAWCTGTYRGRIIETIAPRCAPGKACPAVLGVRDVGTYRFRVS